MHLHSCSLCPLQGQSNHFPNNQPSNPGYRANQPQVTNDMLQQLTGVQEGGSVRHSAAPAAAAGEIVFGDLNSTTSQDR
jgi:hypothetical protein